MQFLSFLTTKGRARNRARKLFKGKTQVAINVDNALICLSGIKAIYSNKKLIAAITPEIIFGLYFTPEKLTAEFEKGMELILAEDQPDRRRYAPELIRTRLDNWLWTDSSNEPLDWEKYIIDLIVKAENFLYMLLDAYEIEGKSVANYRLEQMYYPLCDIVTLAEAFFNEVTEK